MSDSRYAFPGYCDGKVCNSNSASAAVNKWMTTGIGHFYGNSYGVDVMAKWIQKIGGRSVWRPAPEIAYLLDWLAAKQ